MIYLEVCGTFSELLKCLLNGKQDHDNNNNNIYCQPDDTNINDSSNDSSNDSFDLPLPSATEQKDNNIFLINLFARFKKMILMSNAKKNKRCSKCESSTITKLRYEVNLIWNSQFLRNFMNFLHGFVFSFDPMNFQGFFGIVLCRFLRGVSLFYYVLLQWNYHGCFSPIVIYLFTSKQNVRKYCWFCFALSLFSMINL